MTILTHDLAMPRDRRLIQRLSRRPRISQLPEEHRLTTGPRTAAVLSSHITRYWNWMTAGQDPRDIPVPPSIADPGDTRWDEALLANHEDRNERIIDLYELSPQDRVQLRDAVRYTIMDRGRHRAATEEQLRAYARRFCLQLNDILRAGRLELRATVFMLPETETLRAMRFDLDDYSGGTHVGWRRLEHEDQLLRMLPPEARGPAGAIETGNPTLRVYDRTGAWCLKASSERFWSEAQALHDADMVMDDHMGSWQEGSWQEGSRNGE